MMESDLIDDHSHCETCFTTKCSEGCPIVACDELCGAQFHWCKKREHASFCMNLKVPCINHHYGCPEEMPRKQLASHLPVCPANVICCTCNGSNQPFDTKEQKLLVPIHAKKTQVDDALASHDEMPTTDVVKDQHKGPSSSCPERTSDEMMSSLSIPFSSVPRIHATPYLNTFMGSQVFRRDEYLWHVKNIHAEICAWSDGWIEEKCPLACYGCTYSVKRLYPNTKGSVVVYNPLLDSFGMQPYVPKLDDDCDRATNMTHSEAKDTITTDNNMPLCKDDSLLEFTDKCNIGPQDRVANSSKIQATTTTKTVKSTTNLTELPVEILQYIAQFLDGFSLNNLALTSDLLKEVCNDIVRDKGVVVQRWAKESGEKCWKKAGLHWLFPNSVTPIESWKFDKVPEASTSACISDHLKTCAYNIKVIHPAEPIKVMLG